MNKPTMRVAILLGFLVLVTALSCTNPVVPSSAPAGNSSSGPAAALARKPVGTLELFLKDFPLGDRQVASVWVEILSIKAHGEATGWTTVFANPKGAEFDLLELSTEPAHLSTTQLAPDLYTQIRLVLGSANRVTLTGSGDFPLVVPSGEQTGIKIVGEFSIKEGADTTLVLDFDAQQSVKLTGRGKYHLKPVIRIESVSYTASSNQPPAASFRDLQASGAGSPVANGFYRESGSNQGRPKYDQIGGGCFLYYLLASDLNNAPFWSIQTAVDTTLLDALYYSGEVVAMTAPEGTWSLGSGLDPAPAVQRAAITGTLAAGQTLTGHYLFSDPDGDAEGATALQWYRFLGAIETDPANGTAIAGATAITYAPQAGDASRFLRLQVTPVDARGQAGAPTLSGAVGPIR